jgi:hypothetical protein
VAFSAYHSQSAVSASSTACTGSNPIHQNHLKFEYRPTVTKFIVSVGDSTRYLLVAAPRHIPKKTATTIQGLASIGIAACKKLAGQLGVVFRARELDIIG